MNFLEPFYRRTTFWITYRGGFYFRVFGYGLSVERNRRASFSERVGAKHVYRLGRIAVEFLTPENLGP